MVNGAPLGGFPPIRGVLFDKDGTLFDFGATWAGYARDLLERESRGEPARVAAMGEAIGFDPSSGRFRPGSPAVAASTAEVAALLLPFIPGGRLDALVARMDAAAEGLAPVEAAPLRPLLAALARDGLLLGVATNDGEAPARAHLAAAGIADLLPFVAGFDSGWGAKPGDGQLRAFAAWAGLAPTECAMVGDSVHDLVAARAAGMAAVAVLSGPAGEADLRPFADAVLPSVAALPGWLAGRGASATVGVADGAPNGAARG